MSLLQPFEKAPLVRTMINIGALLDIITGTWIQGKYGEWLLNGGLAQITGITGKPNTFKSTLQRYMSLKASARMKGSSGSVFDTEINMHESHQAQFAASIEEFDGELVFDTGRWVLSNKAQYSGNEYYDMFKAFMETKIKSIKENTVELPFLDRDGTTLMKVLIPTFSDMDSLTQFDTDDVIKMQEENAIGESGGNTIFMRQGLAKKRFLDESPRLNTRANNYLSMTAHLGKESGMATAGPPGAKPPKQMQHLSQGDQIKGTSPAFLTLTHNLWNAASATPMINQGTKTVEYPKDTDDNLNLDTDLNLLTVKNLRGKAGVSGVPLQLVVSQHDGILASLSEFHYLKENGRYGLEGSNISYSLILYPDVKLGRTTIRGKIATDPLLRYALTITSQMCQMKMIWNGGMGADVDCTPKELYDDLIKLGYDWNILLACRNWWTYDNDKQAVPFLSTMDLLCMRLPKDNPSHYHPYWLSEDKKSIKKEFKQYHKDWAAKVGLE